VFAIGGAQAIGALAYGTATIPAVHKITGPGNAYVASAKRRVFGTVGIDMIAGPSEILVLADGTTPPTGWRWTCSARPSTTSWRRASCSARTPAISTGCSRRSSGCCRRCRAGRDPRLARRPRRAGPHPLDGGGLRDQQPDRARAPRGERARAGRWEPLLRHAGAIFLGAFTSESLGDYCAGPNHVLPTAGTARFSSPLGVYDFQKRTSLIEVSAARRRRARADRRRAGARRRPARPRRGAAAACTAAETVRSSHARSQPSTADRIAAVIRQDVKSMHAYAIQDSAGLVKLDAMENPFRLPEALQRALGERLGRWRSTAIRSLRRPGDRALSRYVKLPAGCKLMLGNGSDELISLLAMACDLPGATILAPVPAS
jgi:hypothetical protein